MTLKLNISDLKVSGEGNLTVSTGAGLSANTVNSIGVFTLDQSANVAGSASLTINALSASGAITIAAGSGSGEITLTEVTGAGAFTLGASNFDGLIDLKSVSVAGNLTVELGSKGDLSAGYIGTFSDITIDARNAMTGSIVLGGTPWFTGNQWVNSINDFSAGGNFTLSMGDGAGDPNRSGSIILGRGKTGVTLLWMQEVLAAWLPFRV